MLTTVILTALAVAFILIAVDKLGYIDKIAFSTQNPVILKLLNCVFCMAFWLSVVAALLIALLTWDMKYLAIIFFVAPIVRFII